MPHRPEEVIESILASEQAHRRATCAFIFGAVNDWMLDDDIATCNNFIHLLIGHISQLSAEIIAAVLGCTYAGKEQLPSRMQFLQSSRPRLAELIGEDRAANLVRHWV